LGILIPPNCHSHFLEFDFVISSESTKRTLPIWHFEVAEANDLGDPVESSLVASMLSAQAHRTVL
jgi:hypothetical protein